MSDQNEQKNSDENQPEAEHSPAEQRLIDGYNAMMDYMRQLMERLEKAEEEARPKVQQMLETAREKTIELNKLTQEEAKKVSEYVKRDIDHAAEFLVNTEKDLAEWLGFDFKLIENWLWEAFQSVADKTRLELMAFKERFGSDTTYKTGEVTGPGALECTECGCVMNFKKTVRIPPCPKCHKTEFKRAIK